MGESAGARITSVEGRTAGAGKRMRAGTGSAIIRKVQIDEIQSLPDLEALEPEWTTLLDQSPGGTPFSSPEWLCPWWRHFGGVALRCLAVRVNGVLAGLAPLYLHAGARGLEMRFVGTGNSDHLGVLALKPYEQLVAREVARRLESWAERGVSCELNRLTERSPLLEIASANGSSWKIQREEPCPVVRLPPRGSATGELPPRSLARRIAYARRRASRIGAVEVEIATEETLGSRLDALFSMHGERWALRGEVGVLADARVRGFLSEAARGLLRCDRLDLFTLQMDGSVIGSLLALRDDKRMYYYIGGFSPAHRKLSPGLLLMAAAMDSAIERGLEEFDFLSGRESYKYEFGAVDEPAWCMST